MGMDKDINLLEFIRENLIEDMMDMTKGHISLADATALANNAMELDWSDWAVGHKGIKGIAGLYLNRVGYKFNYYTRTYEMQNAV
jgi:hypothetical protein